jgi:UDP-N-acetylmuramyl pentapeptide phosphotransferase/UDP-N-acetylglucosamine-1-phosphate transferase
MALIVALVAAAVLTPVAAVLARRVHLVDNPGPLKVHESSVPYLGGAAVMVAVALAIGRDRPSLLIPLACAFALGLLDDVAGLRPILRLAVELAIGVSAAFVLPADGVGAFALVTAAVVLLLNAVNLLDGLDGLAGGVCAVSGIGFAVVLSGPASTLALAVAGACAGFLVWNRPPARIYLGDSGSYLLGTALALLLARVLLHGAASEASAALLLVGVPVGDTAIAILRRVRARRSLFGGDRSHVYDQLVDRGYSRGWAVVTCVAAQAILALGAIAISSLSAALAVAVSVSVVLVVGTSAVAVFVGLAPTDEVR